MNQTDFGAMFGLSQTCYSRYERGTRDIPPEILIQLARYHQTSVDYLLGLTDQKAPYPRKKQESE